MSDEANMGEDIVSSEEEVEDDEEENLINKSSSSVSGCEEEESETEKPDVANEYENGESMDTTDRSNEQMETETQESHISNVNDDELNEDDDEYSYHSSPPMSPNAQIPSQPRSPSPLPQQTNHHDVNTTSITEMMPKESLDEDREGELDFEEDTVEDTKEETESTVELNIKKANDSSKIDEDDEEIEEQKPKKSSEKNDNADPDDDGEVEDDDDLEEGEVKDSSSRKVPQRPMCRFFNKGQCTWGNNCRFLHPGINDKGNYNMFASSKSNNGQNSNYSWQHGSRPDHFYGKGYSDSALAPPPVPPPPPPTFDEPHRESAWERGLRHAKEILKKSSQRKEMEPDFEEKRLNLSLSSADAYNDYEKENDYYSRTSPYRRNSDRYPYDGYDDALLDPFDRQAHEYWRGGNYENFEVRYMRSDYEYRDDIRNDRIRESERNRMERAREREREVYHMERDRDGRSRRDKFERQHTPPDRSWREDPYIDSQSQNRSRGDEWRDPWRRSTSPKRVDQRRSYSSNSSASYTSSHSSGSRSYTSGSRSSSASSHSSYSSRSYSRGRNPQVKTQQPQHKMYVDQIQSKRNRATPPSSQPIPHSKMSRHQQDKWGSSLPNNPVQGTTKALSPNSANVDKKKMKSGPNRSILREGSASSTGSSRSRSHSGSSHSSGSSHYRSRGSSASSLESVSSKSSISSKSSYDSPGRGQGMSGYKHRDERQIVKDKRKIYDSAAGTHKTSSDKVREHKTNVQIQTSNRMAVNVNANKGSSKDLLKQSGQKTQIKLTLLNKEKAVVNAGNVPVITHRPNKENLDTGSNKKPSKVVENSSVNTIGAKQTKQSAVIPQSRKRPASPPHVSTDSPTAPKKINLQPASSTNANVNAKNNQVSSSSATSKKSTSSRREELLKQLKAVEDAIARKRAKLS